MKGTFAFLLLVFLPAVLAAQVDRALRSSPLVFNHVTVIDVRRGQAMPDMTVVIQGDRIAAVGKAARVRIPKNAQIINGRGKFLIPGLWDMHIHLGGDAFDRNHSLRLFIANGVTGVRFMDGDREYHAWRKQAEDGSLIAPRMFISSPTIGFADLANISEARVRDEVRKAKREGADFIKVHDLVSRDAYFALFDEAKRVKLDVAGHVPTSITVVEASNAGQKSIEHSSRMDEATSDMGKANSLIAVLKTNHTWVCPTLLMRTNYASLDEAGYTRNIRLKYAESALRNRWMNMAKEAAKIPSSEWTLRKELIRKEKTLLAKMARSGIGILAGTDVPNLALAGFSLHDELASMSDAGMKPIQVLQAATINPARFFGKLREFGTVESGKLADLVLLEANPLEKIENTRKIHSVLLNGRLFDRKALDKMLAEIEAAAK